MITGTEVLTITKLFTQELYCTFNYVDGATVQAGTVLGTKEKPHSIVLAPRIAGKSEWALCLAIEGNGHYLNNDVGREFVWA